MSKIILSEIPTRAPKDTDRKEIEKTTSKMIKKIGELQNKIYAEKKHSVLVVLQGMDASGKDGATKNVFGRCNPSGIDAFSFKKPTEEEFSHDFLWRCHKIVPAKGHIHLFIRSHYEDILIQRVHNWIDDVKVAKRMTAINNFEDLIKFDNKTTVLKFYMHISLEKQEEKLQERIDLPEINWKHNPSDWEERKLWSKYMEAYEYAINESCIPWHIIPVDQRWYRDYCIAKVVLEELKSLDPKLPLIETSEK